MSNDANPLRIITPVGRLSYPHLFAPWGGPNGDQTPKFGATIVFDADTDLTSIKEVIAAAGAKKFGGAKKFETLLAQGVLHNPLRQNDEKYPEGSWYIGARTDKRPGVVDRTADPQTTRARVITVEEQETGNQFEMYPGCLIRISVTCFGYNNVGKGVSFALNNVQRMGDAERFDSRVKADDEFDAEMAEAPASLDDILS